MDEIQQPSVTQELGRHKKTPVQEMEGGEVTAVSFLGLALVNHLLQQLIQIILVLQHGLPQNGQFKKYGVQKQRQRNHGSLCRIKQPQKRLPGNLLFFLV